MKTCLNCKKELFGRLDKKYCDVHCKSAYHYLKSRVEQPNFYQQVDHRLKQNRRLLKIFNKSGKSTIREEKLLAEGFNPKFFTHYWKNRNGDVYLFCYEFGFLKRKESAGYKYVLVEWQEYMS